MERLSSKHLLTFQIFLFLISLSEQAANTPWGYKVSYLSSTSPMTYTPGSSVLPFTVGALTYDTTSDTSCVTNTDQLTCSVPTTYPPNESTKFQFTYSLSTNYLLNDGSSTCILKMTTLPICYTDTIQYSGTTEQIVLYPVISDTTSCTGTYQTSIAQPVVLYVDCSGFTSTSSSSSTSTTTTSTSTSTTTTPTTTPSTTTTFIQSPAGIAVLVVAIVAGTAILGLTMYFVYKCCCERTGDGTGCCEQPPKRNPAPPTPRISRDTRIIYPEPQPASEDKRLPNHGIYYDDKNSSFGSPAPQWRPNA